MTLHVMTASLLREGLVAYLQLEGEASSWTTEISRATAVAADNVAQLKMAAEISESGNVIIAPYVIDVIQSDTGLQAATKREQIRAAGPTIQLPRDSSALNHSVIIRGSAARHAA